MLKTIIETMVILSISGIAVAATAPEGAPGKLAEDQYYVRCTNEEIKHVEACMKMTFFADCLTPEEMRFAIEHSLGVACIPFADPPQLHSACPCSCFEKGTQIGFLSDDYQDVQRKPIEEIKNRDFVATLTESADISTIDLENKFVSYATSGPEVPALFIFEMANGASLPVTETHAILLANGKMVAAKDVKASDFLVTEKGEQVEIKRISRRQTDTVYNFLVETPNRDMKGHVISANGFLVGDLAWQNALGSELNRVLLRK